MQNTILTMQCMEVLSRVVLQKFEFINSILIFEVSAAQSNKSTGIFFPANSIPSFT